MRIPITGHRVTDEATMRMAIAANAAARSAAQWRKKLRNLPVIERIRKKYSRLRWKVAEIARIVRS